ncbi:MAG: amidohydrolase family protein [Armatimonadota bacterium]
MPQHPHFELNDVDRQFWAERLDPHLPQQLFDAHRHITIPDHINEDEITETHRNSWPFEVARFESIEQARFGYRELFPGRQTDFLAFGAPHMGCRYEQNNDYLADGLSGTDSAALALVPPTWDTDRVLENLRKPNMIGIKVYQGMIPGFSGEDVSVFDFCTHEHLALLNDLGGWLTLHLPRAERLAHPDNIAEVLEIREKYPNIVLVIAHIGRSYPGRYAREGLPPLADDDGIYFDTCAVLNPAVFAVSLDRIGPQRLLFGSDFPILYMRGRRRWEGDKYINLTSGDYGWNTDREPPEVEATYTLYIYEAMAACIDMTLALGFGEAELSAIFNDNARGLIDKVLARKESW